MSGNVLLRVSRGQLQVVEDAIEAAKSDVEESWKSERHKAVVARNLQGMISLCRDIPNVLHRLWNSTFDLITARLIEDYSETGAELQKLFAQARHILTSIERLVQSFERLGGSVEGAEALHGATEEVQRLEASVFEHWPWFTEEDLKEALAAYERGECLEASEAFAQIAGVDKQTWLRRVEEHKRAKQS